MVFILPGFHRETAIDQGSGVQALAEDDGHARFADDALPECEQALLGDFGTAVQVSGLLRITAITAVRSARRESARLLYAALAASALGYLLWHWTQSELPAIPTLTRPRPLSVCTV